MDEVDLTEVNWFEIEDGEYIILQQNCLDDDERSDDLDEIIIHRSAALELAYKIISTLEEK